MTSRQVDVTSDAHTRRTITEPRTGRQLPPCPSASDPRTLALFAWRTRPDPAATPYPRIELAGLDGIVDRVLPASEPYPFSGEHLAEVRAALPGARVSLIDGEMVSWCGGRAIAGLLHLADFTQEQA